MERADDMIGDGLRRGSDDGAVGDRVADGMAPYGGLPAAARDGCDDLDGDDDFDGDGPAGDGCGERYEHFAITVDRGQSMIRLDKFLVDRMEHCSRNRIQTAADNGSILVNGVAAKASYKVKPLDRITMVMPYPKRELEIVPEAIPLDIVYEDDDLLIVNKPAGMVDLGMVARAHQLTTQGLRTLAANLFGQRISKGPQCSNWSVMELSKRQVIYAATDAWIGRAIYLRMRELGMTGEAA